MNINFDVIIATYNRIEKAIELATIIEENAPIFFQRIIIIDSSEIKYTSIIKISQRIEYYHSSIKNQPFQRYFGFTLSKANHVLFLDDDMEIRDNIFFHELKIFFESNSDYCALNIPFENINSFIENNPKSVFNSKYFIFNKLKGLISGYPILKDNTFGFNGIRGKRVSNKPIEYLSGGAFAVKRLNFYSNFNMHHFRLYSQKLGMGEDALLGYTISKQGMIWAWEKTYLYHRDLMNSAYADTIELFAKRYLYSRLDLSLEYARLNNFSLIYAYLSFFYFSLFRIIGVIFIMVYKANSRLKAKKILIGYLKALFLTLNYKYSSNLSNNKYWEELMQKELEKNMSCAKS